MQYYTTNEHTNQLTLNEFNPNKYKCMRKKVHLNEKTFNK